MIIRLILRSAGPGRMTIDTDFKRESRDTPRIANLGLEIKGELDNMKKRIEEKGVIYA